MAEKGPGKSSGKGKFSNLMELMANELTYIPTPEQRKVKSSLWHRIGEMAIHVDPSEISLEFIQSIIIDDRIANWWEGEVGFKEWMRNKEEFRERIDYLSFLALDTLEMLLVDRTTNANAKVAAIKLLMEVGRKMPPKVTVEKFLDEKVSDMDKKELEEYIKKNLKLVGGNK